MLHILFFLVILKNANSNIQIVELELSINNVLKFVETRIEKLGFDGLFGLMLAQTQIMKVLNNLLDSKFEKLLKVFNEKCNIILVTAEPFLPKNPTYITFKHKLLSFSKWIDTLPNNFTFGKIVEFGIYENWTSETILKNKHAAYKGVATDFCLKEILELSNNKICYIGKFCQEMMLDISRVDTGYFLTHRLLYMQIKRLLGCSYPGDFLTIKEYSQLFCSYIYKEAKTNEYLGYPYHDLFLEQVVLCGMEGYSEFLKEKWLKRLLKWQQPHGCFKSIANSIEKRTSKILDFGCSDHATGLGLAALSLYLRYLNTCNITQI